MPMPVCPCGCGRATTRLFAPGHDTRMKSALRTSVQQQCKVLWYTAATENAFDELTVDDALARILDITGSDWSPYVLRGEPVVRVAPPRRSSPTATRAVKTATRAARVDALMQRLDARGIVVGVWGWHRPPDHPDERYPARVQRTRRDVGDSTIDLFVPGDPSYTVTGVPSESFMPDPMAKP